jgi:mono/diheme cytochrome c family protein
MPKRFLWVTIIGLFLALVQGVQAEEARSFRLRVAPELESSGLMAHLLPRFALKTGRRAELVQGEADITILPEGNGRGIRLMARDGRGFALERQGDNPAAGVFTDWITSDIGKRTIEAFVPTDGPVFLATVTEAPSVEITFDGDPVLGATLAAQHCARCHVVRQGEGVGIGSTPSFPALRALPNWAERALSFYVLNPHPAFMQIADVTPAFDPLRPPPIVPVELTLDQVEAIQAFIATLEPADLGAPIQMQ